MSKKNIEVVVLAAGIGSRLRPLTDNLPKCLIELNGETLLGRLLRQLLKHDKVKQVHILTGHEHLKLDKYLKENFSTVKTIYNDDFKTTNNMYSLSMFMEKRNRTDDLIIINADCIYDNSIVDRCIEFEGSCIMTDSSTYMEESMKVKVIDSYVKEISKGIEKGPQVMTSIDLYKFQSDEAEKLNGIVNDYMEKKDLKQWTEVAINDLVMETNSIKPNDISGSRWFEIDNIDDLNQAKKLFKNG